MIALILAMQKAFDELIPLLDDSIAERIADGETLDQAKNKAPLPCPNCGADITIIKTDKNAYGYKITYKHEMGTFEQSDKAACCPLRGAEFRYPLDWNIFVRKCKH